MHLPTPEIASRRAGVTRCPSRPTSPCLEEGRRLILTLRPLADLLRGLSRPAASPEPPRWPASTEPEEEARSSHQRAKARRGQARPQTLPSSRVAHPQRPRRSEPDLQPPQHVQGVGHPRRRLEAELKRPLPRQAEQPRSWRYRPSRRLGQECHPQMPEASEPLPEGDPGPRLRCPRRPPQTGLLQRSVARAGAASPLPLPPSWKLLASFGKAGAWLSRSR